MNKFDKTYKLILEQINAKVMKEGQPAEDDEKLDSTLVLGVGQENYDVETEDDDWIVYGSIDSYIKHGQGRSGGARGRLFAFDISETSVPREETTKYFKWQPEWLKFDDGSVDKFLEMLKAEPPAKLYVDVNHRTFRFNPEGKELLRKLKGMFRHVEMSKRD